MRPSTASRRRATPPSPLPRHPCAVSRRPPRRAGRLRYVLDRTQGTAGFFGASSMERLPTERAIADQLRAFKQLPAAN
ncbi:phosphoenolpyruvate hydrolase family protein [Streptomyces malaysiensis]|uniref:phosphoenolpyruvate hydrolase family protein n=1 Tax=Streptomyces malaysiensis TaxID=92644 RepID=UPI0022B25859|nr:phosphoenolpyruvate hydrolase family protein [Streptomyces sp. M56]